MADGSRVTFNDARRFGVLETSPTREIAGHRFFAHLGPEPLEKEFTARDLLRRLAGRKTPVKIAIMDQSIVVGVGNIYAAEALFLAGINPKLPAGQLKAPEAALLVTAIRKVLRQAIKAGGSSLRDYVQADGELGYFQHSFAVYDRAGEKCRKCRSKNGIIEKIVQGGRSTFYCPLCQK
jgi:formamidopyrimidine-DNA glycosylase